MSNPSQPSTVTRIVAALLAAIWITGGVLAVALGLAQARWLPPLLGAAAVWYGLIWVRVAREGRLLPWPTGLLPWRRR